MQESLGRAYGLRLAALPYSNAGDACPKHLLALDHLRENGLSEILNLGNGKGYTVREAIELARHGPQV